MKSIEQKRERRGLEDAQSRALTLSDCSSGSSDSSYALEGETRASRSAPAMSEEEEGETEPDGLREAGREVLGDGGALELLLGPSAIEVVSKIAKMKNRGRRTKDGVRRSAGKGSMTRWMPLTCS